MNITRTRLKEIIQEEVAAVKKEQATVAESAYRAAGREFNRMAYDTPESIVNELNILAKAAAGMGLKRSSNDLLEVAYDIEQSVEIEQYSKPVESELEEGMYNKDPRPCADDETYKPPNRNDYRQFGKCVKKDKDSERSERNKRLNRYGYKE